MKPRQFPDKVVIRGVSYCVHFMDQLDGSKVLGACDDTNKLILIAKNQPGSEMLATFWHEVLHAIEKEYRVRLGHSRINRLERDLATIQLQFKGKV